MTTVANTSKLNYLTILPPAIPSPYNNKNAGRKKTNPQAAKSISLEKLINILDTKSVWNFFVDLKIKALSGVRCRYCEWITNDRSPTTLKFHLKRKHDTGLGGIWNIVEERIGIAGPHNRSRPNKSDDVFGADEGGTRLQNDSSCFQDDTYQQGGTRVVVDTKPDVNQQAILDQFIKTATQNAASTSNVGQSLQVESKQEEYYDQERLSGNSSFSESARPKKKPRLNEEIPVENGDCPYQLADNINQLLQVATEIDLTFTFNARRTMEYCFESNSSEMVGKRVVFGDLGTKVYVRERINDVEQDYEEWKKADWKQFLWAVRGKCMSFFKLH